MTKIQLIKEVYKVVNNYGFTSHKFADDDWNMIFEMRDTINRYFDIALKSEARCLFSGVVGYINDGMAKEYEVTIENMNTGEVYGRGIITACAAGTVENVWSSYDICISFWAE